MELQFEVLAQFTNELNKQLFDRKNVHRGSIPVIPYSLANGSMFKTMYEASRSMWANVDPLIKGSIDIDHNFSSPSMIIHLSLTHARRP